MADQPGRRNARRNNRQRLNAGAAAEEEVQAGIQPRHILIALFVLGISITIYFQSTNLISTVYNYGKFNPRDFTKPRPLNPYSSESEAMQNLIKRFAATPGSGKDVIGPGKISDRFMLDLDKVEIEEELEKQEFTPEDENFIDRLIDDIQETTKSKEKKQLQQDINTIERQLGKKVSKFLMSPEELDNDHTIISDEKRQEYEFLNLREGFIAIWIKRMRELKELDPEKYTMEPKDYTLIAKKYLRRNFIDYFQRFWDDEKKQQKRERSQDGSNNLKVPDENEQSFSLKEYDNMLIKEILDAIHYTGSYGLHETLKNKKRELKRFSGMEPLDDDDENNDDEDEYDQVKNMFIEEKREEIKRALAKGNKIKRYPNDYSEDDFEDFKADWEEFMDKNFNDEMEGMEIHLT